MRSLMHFLAILLALPQALLCAAFLLLGHLTAGGTLGSLFLRALDILNAVFTWGGLTALVLLIALLAAGFSDKTRRPAAALVASLVIMSAVILIVQLGLEKAADVLVFFIPGVFALMLSVTLTVTAPAE